ncbi:MAG: FtsQ-type POTRA domain-containing protein [Anaerolineales bacterium]|nr:FtsQ-type POTRA domain-containing protein [Anaerolineales bacterium]MCA9974440.1 FtsQ-type POTRA domain-containing protein [Anaerolineales bacterium]MCB8967942.1 FtsQ-type POTRA domain-containing protein [Ardenticatenaceae bacterium]
MRRRQESKRVQPQRAQNGQRLRKQPKMRRVQSAHVMPVPQVSVPSTAKQRRRRNNQRFHLPKVALKQFIFSSRWISLSLLSLMVFALYLVGMDTHFYLTMIPVEGVWSVPAAEVVTASGLAGTHIFAADPVHAAEQITQVPGVISATVTLSWPNQILVQVGEDKPIAVWREAGRDYWVTENGRIIPSRVSTLGLLQIEAEGVGETAVVTTTSTDATESDELAPDFIPNDVLAGALQLRELRPNIDKLYYRPSSGLSYQDGRGWRAYFGVGTDMAQKLAVYETIVADLVGRGLTPVYISVSNQEKPYYLAN